MPLPTVAIVGRPNVGKSTLFNRLVGKRLALVDDRPGVTRDRREGEARLVGLDFRVIDTAGFEDDDPETLPGRMRRQTEAAVRDELRARGHQESPRLTGAAQACAASCDGTAAAVTRCSTNQSRAAPEEISKPRPT